jgi:hypothetical protein
VTRGFSTLHPTSSNQCFAAGPGAPHPTTLSSRVSAQ